MRCSRFLAALTAAMLLVVYSGCGGEDKKDSSSTGSGGTTQAKPGENSAEQPSRQVPRAVRMLPPRSGVWKRGRLIFRWSLPSDFAAIVIHPRRIAQSPLVAEQLKDEKIAEAIKKFGIDPSEVEQIVVLRQHGREELGRPEPIPVIITRFTHDVDAKEVLTKLQAARPPENRSLSRRSRSAARPVWTSGRRLLRWPMPPARTPSF